MAGTLVITTLSDGTNSTSSTNCIQGSAKAWINFDGNTGSGNTIRASYNISSVTRNATASFTINMTNALADGNYAYVVGVQNNVGAAAGYTPSLNTNSSFANTAPTSSSFSFTQPGATGNYNPVWIYATVFR